MVLTKVHTSRPFGILTSFKTASFILWCETYVKTSFFIKNSLDGTEKRRV